MKGALLILLVWRIYILSQSGNSFILRTKWSSGSYAGLQQYRAGKLEVLKAEREAQSNANDSEPPRKKANKYAKFSKASNQQQDPWDRLMEESTKKAKRIRLEKELKANRIKFEDVQFELMEDESFLTDRRERKRNAILYPDATKINPYDPTTFGYIELGTVMSPHGVKGQVKFKAVSDFASERLCPGSPSQPIVRHLKPKTRRSPRQITLIDGKLQLGDVYILTFEGIGTLEAAMKIRGSVLYAREEDDRPKLNEGEFIASDLVGLEVFLDESYYTDNEICQEVHTDGLVGIVRGIVFQEDLGSLVGLGNDYLEVGLPQKNSSEENLVLIPFVPQIVPYVDVPARSIYVNPPNGLLDLSYVRSSKVRIRGFLPATSSYLNTNPR